jgi:NTP pyrophosphatase (non-canonical NTP hydrolase)
MDANSYQQLAARTLIDRPDAEYSDDDIMLIWNALGVAGEAGEVADLVKKSVFHRHGIDAATKEKLVKELGDVLWYVAALCTRLDVPLGEVMEVNIAKLRERYPEGYSSVASKLRRDE